MLEITRRSLLASSGVLALSACAKPPFSVLSPSDDDLLVDEFISRQRDLIDIYLAAINQEINYTIQLTELKDNHITHLELWTSDPEAIPNPTPTGLQVASINQLITAEQAHVDFCLTSCLKTDNVDILLKIGQIVASGVQDIYWLNKLITPVVPTKKPSLQGLDVTGEE